MGVLATVIKPKVFFDVTNEKHVSLYRKFLGTYKWGIDGCPFILEYPYLSIPDMITDKLIHSLLKVKKQDFRSWK